MNGKHNEESKNCSVYARNGLVFVYLPDDFESKKRGAGYPVGSNIIAFIRLDFKEGIDKLFTDYIRLVFNIDLCVTEDDYNRQRNELIENHIIKLPFLFFAFHTLQECLIDYINGEDFNEKMIAVPNYNEFNKLFADRYDNEPQALFDEFASAVDSSIFTKMNKDELQQECARYHLFLCLKDALLFNLEETQKIFKDEMFYLYQKGKVDAVANLTPKQRLYIYDRHRNITTGKPMFYVGMSRTVKTLAHAEHKPKTDEPQADELNTQGINTLADYVVENDIDLIEVQEIDTFDELMRFEMMQLVESDTVISMCENCGNLFIPRGRKDMLFCNMMIPELNKTCAEIGAHRKYSEKTKENPIYEAYNKAYKRNHSRRRKKRMSESEFWVWSEEAQAKRKMCVDGGISLKEFVEWLEK
jgi:Zn-finger nucleic acid-binding protein